MDTVRKINDIMVSLFNTVLKLEEKALKESAEHNLSITEIHTLDAVGQGKAKTMTQVAGILKVNVSTLTSAINKLVSKGYVNRFRVPEDRRIVKIELTERGLAAVREHESYHLAMIRDAIADLTPEDAERLVAAIESLNEFVLMRKAAPVQRDGPLELLPMKIGELAVPTPIFQGGMGVGVSGSRLAAAVARLGGVGVIAGTQIGFLEPDFQAAPLTANLRALRREIQAARKAVAGIPDAGPIGVNLMTASRDYEAMVRAAVEAGAQIIFSGAGLPTALPGICKDRNVKLVPVISSVRAVKILIKNWAKKYNRTPDAIVFEGALAGGHLGFKEEQLSLAREDFYKTITEIRAELEPLQNCPLIVGGGIYTRSDVEKVLAYGADGVQVGTRFVTTEECDAPDAYKAAYLAAAKKDITVIRTPIGMPAQVLENDFVRRINAGEKMEFSCNGCLSICEGAAGQYCTAAAMIRAARGDTGGGLVLCGVKAARSKTIEKTADVFRDLTGSGRRG